MFGRPSKSEMEAKEKEVAEKIIACDQLIYDVMANRLVNGPLTEPDNRMMEPSVLELYKLILESPKKLREYVITNIFGIDKNGFNFDDFFNGMKLKVFMQLQKEGKIHSK